MDLDPTDEDAVLEAVLAASRAKHEAGEVADRSVAPAAATRNPMFHALPHSMGDLRAFRFPNDDEALAFEQAVAASLAESEGLAEEDATFGLLLDEAVAQSIQSAETDTAGFEAILDGDAPIGWDCAKCTLRNEEAAGRCAACLSDRVAPFSSGIWDPEYSRPTEPTQCGLPGCVASRAHHDYCTEEHERRALARGLLAPAVPGVERVFVGATGEYACALLTKAHPDRAGLIAQFQSMWRKPGRPRVERVYSVTPSVDMIERYQRLDVRFSPTLPWGSESRPHLEDATFSSSLVNRKVRRSGWERPPSVSRHVSAL
eukprot:m.244149 g.244149  ORF g.244149 m.244149 type:complete len:316 (-) comp15843_c0_seq4:3173-4120(-)